jgi:predicted SprT family Zn-dependent metalloprotease
MNTNLYRCAACGQPMPNFGRVRRVVDGVSAWVGRCCSRKLAQ